MEMLHLPMGRYFTPKPYECIQYLSFKVHGSQDLCRFWNGLIFDCNPYSAKQIPDLFSTDERRDNLYFFTKLRRKGKIGSVNIDRTIIDGVGQNKGSWHGDQTKEVCDADDISVIGSASTFTFWGKKGDPNDRRFLMTEYQLQPTIKGNGDGHGSADLHYDPLKDHVLCHLRCSPQLKRKKTTSSINILKMSYCAPPLQLPCPAAHSDMITSEAFPSCSTNPANHESASPTNSLQTPTYSPIHKVLADTAPTAMEWDDVSNAQLEFLTGTTGNDEDVLAPPSSTAPFHVYNDDQIAVISVAAADNSSCLRHDAEPRPVLPLANAEAIPSPALLDNPTAAVEDVYDILFDMVNAEVTPSPAFLDSPTAAVEDDYDIIFDTLPPINFQSHSSGLSWDDMSEFLDREELIGCYDHPVFHDIS